jgi:septum formation protein
MLVLASASPRRAEILRTAGISFVVRPSHIEENLLPGESAENYVRRLAREKALAAPASDAELVLSADTTVHLAGTILEKPVDDADATSMLRLLAGRTHEVVTGICLRQGDRIVVDCEITKVRFLDLTGQEIAGYVASGEPAGKAGAYAIQGLASKFIDRVEGCYFNVVGLPVSLVWRRLKEFQAY